MDGQLPFGFKFKYCNLDPIPNLIREGELVYIEVKIKAEVRLLEEFP